MKIDSPSPLLRIPPHSALAGLRPTPPARLEAAQVKLPQDALAAAPGLAAKPTREQRIDWWRDAKLGIQEKGMLEWRQPDAGLALPVPGERPWG
jgi:hypothetical protein